MYLWGFIQYYLPQKPPLEYFLKVAYSAHPPMLFLTFFSYAENTQYFQLNSLSETGILPRRDSSRNRIPPKTGFLPKRDSSRNCREIFVFGEESRFGRNPVSGGIPFREEFSGRNPVWEESRSGGILVGRSSVGGIIWEESCMGGIPMEPIKTYSSSAVPYKFYKYCI